MSFHMIIEIPVLLSDRVERVPVEVQIRTIAMDLWASLEHKIYNKYERAVPPRLLNELTDAAEAAHNLDVKMQRLHNDVAALTAAHDDHDVHLDLLPPSTIDVKTSTKYSVLGCRNTVGSTIVPTETRKIGTNSAPPTNTTCSISGLRAGIARLRPSPPKNVPTMPSIFCPILL